MQIPPGYKDKNPKKEGFKKYGDGVVWFQVIDYAKSRKQSIILITDDEKDDWWRIEKGETLGPRPELTAEIGSKAKVSFYMYNSSQFLKYAKEFLGLKVKQKAIEEVERDQKYHRSNLAQRVYQVENAVYEWLKRFNPDVQLLASPYDTGVDYVITQPDGTKLGIQLKYRSMPFSPADLRRSVEYFINSEYRWK